MKIQIMSKEGTIVAEVDVTGSRWLAKENAFTNISPLHFTTINSGSSPFTTRTVDSDGKLLGSEGIIYMTGSTAKKGIEFTIREGCYEMVTEVVTSEEPK